MNFHFTYSDDYARVIRAVIIDARITVPEIQNADSLELKAFTDKQVAAVDDTVLPFKIETDQGNLAGYFSLQFNADNVSILQYQLRSAFVTFKDAIQLLINNFVTSGEWRSYYLL